MNKHPRTLYEVETALSEARFRANARLCLLLAGAIFSLWAIVQLAHGVRDEQRRVDEIRKDWPSYGRE